MGLDMYLKAGRMLFQHDDKYRELTKTICKSLNCNASSVYVQVDAGYWRKANAIHDWFSRNCSSGEIQNCTDYSVSRKQLDKLREDCLEVLADPSKASKLIPTQSGFFWGSTEYDEYYIRSLQNTVKIIDDIKTRFDSYEWCFVYFASW